MEMMRAGVNPLEVGRWTPAQSRGWIKATVEREKRMDERAAWVTVAVMNQYRKTPLSIDEFLGRSTASDMTEEKYQQIKERIKRNKAAANG